MAKAADIKTKPTAQSVEGFLNKVPNAQRRADSFTVLKMMAEATNEPPKMWGPSIVGFGSYHYKYESGREGDMCLIGFSPRAQALTLYIMPDFGTRDALLKKLGKHTTSKACLYIKKLSDIDLPTLKALIFQSVKAMRAKV